MTSTYNPTTAHAERRATFLHHARQVMSRDGARDLAYAYWSAIYSEPGYTDWLDEAPEWVRAAHTSVMKQAERSIGALELAGAASLGAYKWSGWN